jgi:hypothetical protein
VRFPLAGFQTGVLCAVYFSKDNCFIGNQFARFQNRQDCPLQVSKALGATPRKLSSNRSKGFEFAGFKKLSANSKAINGS